MNEGGGNAGGLRAMLAAAAEGEGTKVAQEGREGQEGRPRRHGDVPKAEMDPASGWIEDLDLYGDHDGPETREDQDRRVRMLTRQVGVRLSGSQYAELEGAASLYGVAPGTMARILVRRGARAVLDHHRRYDLEQDMRD